MIGEFIMKLLHARTSAHVMHLQTRSYATHQALEDFYTALVDFVDELAETWQGDYGLITEYPARYTPYTEPVKLMEDLGVWIEGHRSELCDEDDTYLQAAVDDVCALVRQTQYRIKFLK